MRRIFKWILIGLACVIALAIIAVQAVLWSDLPRDILVPRIAKSVGLKLHVGDLSTGWLGHTTLRDVRVSLPLADKPFLAIPTLKLDHHNLVRLAVTGELGLSKVTITQPQVLLRRLPDGRWNLLAAKQILQAHLTSDHPKPTAGPLNLPAVTIIDAGVRLVTADDKAVQLEHIKLTGQPASALHYTLTLKVPALGVVKVALLPAPPYEHEATFDMHPEPAWLSHVVGRSVPAISIQGTWRGSFSNGTIAGTLSLERSAVTPRVALWGDAAVTFNTASQRLTLEPTGIVLGPKPDLSERTTGRVPPLGASPRDQAVSLAPKAQLALEGSGQAVAPHADGRLSSPVRRSTSSQPTAYLTLTDGKLTYTVGGQAALHQLSLHSRWGDAIVNGQFNPGQQTGQVTATWTNPVADHGVSHHGKAELIFNHVSMRGRQLQLTATSHGESPWGDWQVDLTGHARGPTWQHLTGRFTAATLRMTRAGQTLDLDGLTARLAYADQRLTFESHLASEPAPHHADTNLRPESLGARATYAAGKGTWQFTAQATALRLPGVPRVLHRAAFKAQGDTTRIALNKATLTSSGLAFHATGAYVFDDSEPLTLTATLARAKRDLIGPDGGAGKGPDDPTSSPSQSGPSSSWAPPQDRLMALEHVSADALDGQLKIRGKLAPLNLSATGHLTAKALRYQNKRLGDIAMRLAGKADQNAFHLTVEAPQWLGGKWRLQAAMDRREEHGRVTLHARDTDLALVQEVLDLPMQLQGLGALNVDVDIPRANPRDFVVSGDVAAKDLGVTMSAAHVHADQLTADLHMDQRSLSLTNIHATEADATLQASVSIPLDTHQAAHVKTTLDDWPIRVPKADAVVRTSGTIHGSAVLASSQFTAAFRLHNTLATKGEDLGYVDVDASLTTLPRLAGDAQRPVKMTFDTGRSAAPAKRRDSFTHGVHMRITLNDLEGKLLDGQVRGKGTVDLSQPTATRLVVEWSGIEPGRLEPWLAQARQVQGGVSGRLTIHRATHPHPLGPVQFDVVLDASHLTVQGIKLGRGSAVAYYDETHEAGPRWILEQADLAGAGGRLSLWGRLTRKPSVGRASRPSYEDLDGRDAHPTNRDWYFFANASAEDLSIPMISQALAPKADPVQGRLTAQMTLSAPLASWRSAHGQATMDVRESDFANIPLFGRLYDLLSLHIGKTVPEGTGHGKLRLEQGRVIIPNFVYDNRGLRIDLALNVQDLWRGAQSPITGFAVVSLSPLPKWKLLKPVNEAIASLQSGVTTVRIDGTLSEPKAAPEPFKSLRDAFSGLLGE